VTVVFREDAHVGRLLRALREHEVEDDVRRQLGDRIAVSGSGGRVFLYADTEEAARAAESVTRRVLRAHDLEGAFRVDRWHHEEARWEDAGVPLPSTPAEHEAEHERLEQEETEESRASGIAEWELRIELASHHDASALAERLEQEGYRVVRRSTFLLVGTNNEDEAEALARRLEPNLPAGATIHVEPGGGLAWELMPRNPFAVLGGMVG
jgi:hypothetical protein